MLVIDEESLSCKFCFEVLQDPRVLPCGHSMCHRCIMTNVNFKKLKLKEPFLQAPIVSSDQRINKLYGSVNDQSVKEGICFNCPSCNKECKVKHAEDVSSVFPINYDLKSAVENYLMEKEKGELCVNCGTNVVQVECEDCIERFCEDCFKSIHSSKYLASHRKAPIGTMLTVGKCKKHKKDLDLICKNCKEVVCYLCSLSSSHSGHSCVPIDEHMEEAKAGMSKKIEQVDQNIGCLNVALNKVSSLQEKLVSNQEIYENKVNSIIDDYLTQIEEKRREILKKSQAEHSERMAIVQDQYSTMKGLIENMNGIKNAFEKVLHFRNVTSLITAENQIDTTLQELNCNQLDTSPIFFTQNRNPSSSEFKEFGINKAVSQIMFSYPLDIQCNIRKGSNGKAPLEVPEEVNIPIVVPSSSVPVSSSVPIPKVEFEKSFSNMVAESLNGSSVGKSKDEEEDVYEAFNGKKKKTRSRKR